MKLFAKILGMIAALIAILFVALLYVKEINPHWLWYITRASAIAGYIMVFLLMMTGMGLTSGFIYNWFGPVFFLAFT